MTGRTTLHPVESAHDREVLSRLWQLYAHDLSELRGALPGDDGLFRAGRLPSYLDDPDRSCHLVRHEGAVAGFGLVRGRPGELHVLGEFFVARAARRSGVGREAARLLLTAEPGPWEIAFQEENVAAARFWRRVAADVAGDAWRVEQRPVPGKPEVPPDSWLTLTV